MLSKLFGKPGDPLKPWLTKAVRVCLTTTRDSVPSEHGVNNATTAILEATKDPAVLVLFPDPTLIYPLTHVVVAYWNGTANSGDPLVAGLSRMGIAVLEPLLQMVGWRPRPIEFEALNEEFNSIMEEDWSKTLRQEQPMYAVNHLFRESPIVAPHRVLHYWICVRILANLVILHVHDDWQPWMSDILGLLSFDKLLAERIERGRNEALKQFVREIIDYQKSTLEVLRKIKFRTLYRKIDRLELEALEEQLIGGAISIEEAARRLGLHDPVDVRFFLAAFKLGGWYAIPRLDEFLRKAIKNCWIHWAEFV